MATAQTVTKTVTIGPGESFTLPSGATVVMISDVLQNSCDFELPNPEDFVEYEYIFAFNQDDNDEHPLGGLVNIESLLINGVEVPLEFTAANTDNSGNSADAALWSTQIPANNLLLNNYVVRFVTITFSTAGSDKHDLVTVTLRMPASYQTKVLLKISNDKFPNDIYLLGS